MAGRGLTAEEPRVRLRPVRAEDLPVIEGLLPEAEDGSGLSVICRAGDEAPIGVLQYRLGEPSEGWAKIRWVALVERERRWGLGQEAVRLFEDEAPRRWKVLQFRVNVDVRNGLGLYFWLRLGYRPLDIEGETQGWGTLCMVREVTA